MLILDSIEHLRRYREGVCVLQAMLLKRVAKTFSAA